MRIIRSHENHPEMKASIQRWLKEEGASLMKALRLRDK
jgi:hypothetical protein